MAKYKYGYTAGSFDCLHVGHLRLLKKAKEHCEFLIVAVSTDKLIEEHKGIKPVVPFLERTELVRGLHCVDAVVFQERLLHIYDIIKFIENRGMVFLGDDWKDREEVKWLKEHKLITFFPYTKDVSSSEIKERIINNSDAILKAQQKRKKNG